jgi:hypothetical protein
MTKSVVLTVVQEMVEEEPAGIVLTEAVIVQFQAKA